MLISLSWKNIWRNKVRSLVIIFAIVIGVIGGVGFTAFYNGMIFQRLDMAISNEVSNIQMHTQNFNDNKEIIDTIPQLQNITSTLDTLSKVKAYTLRIKSISMINSANNNSGIVLNGINPEVERKVTNIHKYVKEGNYFSNSKKNNILIGSKLSEKLKIKLRSKVVITMQMPSGEIASAAYKVTGIYKTDNTSFDERNVYVNISDLRNTLGFSENAAHEIAISLYDDAENTSLIASLKKSFPSISIQSWEEIMPELALMTESSNYMLLIFMIIIFLALSFGIINTMLMAVMERVNEIGMLMAIGMNKVRIFLMIMYETILLMLTGSVVGLFLSYLFIELFKRTGIDLSAFASGLGDYGFSTMVYPFLNTDSYVQIVVLVVITGILSSLFPSRKALKLNPSEAIRKL
jgi:ABC-type lipoprotein release transport system permease subunit